MLSHLRRVAIALVAAAAFGALAAPVAAQRVPVQPAPPAPYCMGKASSTYQQAKVTSTSPTTDCNGDKVNECGYTVTYSPPATGCDQTLPDFCCVASQETAYVSQFICDGATCHEQRTNTGGPVTVWTTQACASGTQPTGCSK